MSKAALFLWKRASRRAGVTLTELMIAVAVISIGVVSAMGAFKYINRAITQSRIKTIATNLAQEKMEVLRNKSYFQLLVTTDTANTTGYSPNFPYDKVSYPPQTITLWGMPALTRLVNVDYVAQSGSDMVTLPYTANDSGMKKITISVIWNDYNGSPRKVQVSSFYENPTATVLSSGFYGTVTDSSTGNPVSDALVQVMGYPSWMAYTDSLGAYSFQVSPGSYTLVCSSDVYFSSITAVRQAATNNLTQNNFSLTRVPTGRVSGMAYLRDHLVISQVVAATAAAAGFEIEYVELYNPTTYTITICDAATGANVVKMRYYGESGASHDQDPLSFSCNMFSNTVGSGKFFLISNSIPVAAGGGQPNPNALYTTANGTLFGGRCGYTGGVYLNCIRKENAGAIQIYDDTHVIDTLGWTNNSEAKLAPVAEGTAKSLADGLEGEKQLVRYTSSGTVTAATGRAYDTNDNSSDFQYGNITQRPYALYAWDAAYQPVTGTPAAGAVVTANDGLSASAIVSSTGYFLLSNIATSTVQGAVNTWEISVTSSPGSVVIMGSSSGVTVPYNSTRDLGTVISSFSVDSGIAMGYVYGAGPDYNRRLGNPSILVGCGGETRNTDSQGFYMLFLPTGTVTITANYGGANGSYQSGDVEVDLQPGVVTSVPDFHLSQGGVIMGYVTSGTGPLPDIIVQATYGGRVYSGSSDSSGHFYISAATSSLAYEVTPVIDSMQSYTSQPATPLTATLTVPGSTIFAGTITVTGAMATLEGVLTSGGSSITTGVLVVASTAAISSPLPAVRGDTAPSGAVIYSVSSQADGTYVLDVRYSTTSTYNIAAFYPVVDANSGAVSYSTRAYTGVWVDTAGSSVIKDFTW